MIVRRWEFLMKPERAEDALAMLKEAVKGAERPVRLYVDEVGPTFTVAWEQEFESMAEMERADAKEEANPESAASYRKWCELIQGPGCREIWKLVE